MTDEASACDCDSARRPERQPEAPAPRPEQVPAPAPLAPVIATAPRFDPPRIAVTLVTLPIGLLPRVSRQVALSVWRC